MYLTRIAGIEPIGTLRTVSVRKTMYLTRIAGIEPELLMLFMVIS